MADDIQPEPAVISPEHLGIVLTGGGARGAYQVGVLSYMARKYPKLSVPIVTGVSAGAVNAAHVAAHPGTFQQAIAELRHLWSELTTEQVFRADAGSMLWSAMRTGMRLFSGGVLPAPKLQGLLNTGPLRDHLEEAYAAINGELTGIEANMKRGKLKADRDRHHFVHDRSIGCLGAGKQRAAVDKAAAHIRALAHHP